MMFSYVPAVVYQIQQATEIRLSPAEAADFEKGLATIAKIIKGTIVVEGVPQNGRRAEAKTGAISGSPEEVLRRFAAIYDYGVLRSTDPMGDGKEIFLFAKKYSTGKEIPCVTEGEYIAALSDLNTALATFAADPPVETGQKIVRQIVDSLSSEEKKRCLQEGVSLSQLSGKTPGLLRRLAADTWLRSSIQGVRGAQDLLSRYASTGKLSKANDQGFEYLAIGILTPSGSVETTDDGSVIEKITGQALYSTPLFPTLLPSERNIGFTESESVSEIGTATTRNGNDTAAVGEMTLESLLQLLNKKDAARQYAALPYLKSKIIYIAGTENASPAEVMTAISRLYGLRLQKTKTADKDIWRLQRPPVTALRSPIELPSAAFKMMPLPFLRATGLLNDLLVPAEIQNKPPETVTAAEAIGKAQPLDPITRMSQVKQECRRMATAGIAKMLLLQPKPAIRYQELPEIMRSEIAGYVMKNQTITLFQEFVGRGGGLPPPYIQYFEESVLTLNTESPGGAINGLTLSRDHLPQRIGSGSLLSITLL